MAFAGPHSSTRIAGFLSIAALLMLFSVIPSMAQNNETLQIKVREIMAENSNQGLDSRLKDIGKDLKKLTYSTFRLEQTHQMELENTGSVDLNLLGSNRLNIRCEGTEEDKIRLRVNLSPHDKKARSFESILRIADGGTFIIGGPAYGNGVLILAFTSSK